MDLVRIGDSLGSPNSTNLARYEEARTTYQRALEIRQALVVTNPSNAVGVRDVSNVYQRLGSLLEHTGNFQASLEMSRKGLEISERLFSADPVNFEVRRDVMIFHNQIGRAYLKDDRSLMPTRKNRCACRSTWRANSSPRIPEASAAATIRLQSAFLLGVCLAASQRDTEALEDLKWSTATWESLMAKHQTSGSYKVSTMYAMVAIAGIHARQNDTSGRPHRVSKRAYDLSQELRTQGPPGPGRPRLCQSASPKS